MQICKERRDGRIKPYEYALGQWVLCNHPQLKKGQARGLAFKYYGPFIVRAKYKNGCDYIIQKANAPRSRLIQVHHNNLRVYFQRGAPEIEVNKAKDADQLAKQRKPYTRQENVYESEDDSAESSGHKGDEISD